MLKTIKRHFWVYLLEAIVAIIVFSISLEAFLIYAFLIFLVKIDTAVNYTSQIIKLADIGNEVTLRAIVTKLKITPEEIKKEQDVVKEAVGEETINAIVNEVKGD